MMTLKRRILLFNILTFFTTMVIVVGLTACSGKAINTTDLDSSKPDTVENGQDYAKETQEVQGSNDMCCDWYRKICRIFIWKT